MLPQGTEPLVLADGTKINPENGGVVSDEVFVKVPNTQELKREIVASRMRVSDLPIPPKQMNTLSVILSYSLQGISEFDIANILSIDEDKIITIKESDPYKELQSTIIKNITESDLSDVRGMFIQKSRGAAQVMFDVIEDTEIGIGTKMVAAKDVLDRAGQRPVDVIEHRHKMEGGLTIEYVEKKDDIPTIDITPEEF
tara:strand:- start:203 stop:796 length:594 start_codon:yes stop_codon:yes gene_type:complete